jgi:hypothetical protein
MANIRSTVNQIDDKVAKALSVALFDTVEWLKTESYVGATNQLRSGWDYSIPIVLSDRITAQITNNSEKVINRIAGRSPGKQPPIDPIELWVKKKLKIPAAQAKGVAFAIAKKIAKEGTDRFQTQSNFIDLKLDGSLRLDSRLKQVFLDNFRSALNDNN